MWYSLHVVQANQNIRHWKSWTQVILQSITRWFKIHLKYSEFTLFLDWFQVKALHWCALSSVLSLPIIGVSLLSVCSITCSRMSKIYTWVGNVSDLRLLLAIKESCSSLRLTLEFQLNKNWWSRTRREFL